MRTLRERLLRPARLDVVGLGECSWDEVWLVDDAPAWGGKYRAVGRHELGGGQVATAMVACRRLGLRVAFAGRVGDDAAGRAIVDGLAAEEVEVRVARVAGATSHRSLLLVDRRGERTVIFVEDLPPALDARWLPLELVDEARVLHLDGSDGAAAIGAARRARERGVVVSCDLDSLDGPARDLLALVDVAIVSRGALSDEPRAALPSLRRLGPAIACVTLGESGAIALGDGDVLVQPAFPVAAVDTTACGDTFRAGFLAALLDGADLAGCLRWGAAAAALKTRDLGRRGCPTRAEVTAVLDARRPDAAG